MSQKTNKLFETYLNALKKNYYKSKISRQREIVGRLEALVRDFDCPEKMTEFDPVRAKRFRQRAGLKQTDLAKKLGITQANLSMYESGKRKITLENKQCRKYVSWLNSQNYWFSIKTDYTIKSFDPEFAKAIRITQGLTQTQLGELINVDPGRISRYETGKKPLTYKGVYANRYINWLKSKNYDVSTDLR